MDMVSRHCSAKIPCLHRRALASNFWASVARHVDSGGYRYWFGVVARMADIQDIEQEMLADQEQTVSYAQG